MVNQGLVWTLWQDLGNRACVTTLRFGWLSGAVARHAGTQWPFGQSHRCYSYHSLTTHDIIWCHQRFFHFSPKLSPHYGPFFSHTLTYCTHSRSGWKSKQNLKFDLVYLAFSWLVVWTQRAVPQAAVEGSAGGSSAEVYAVPTAVEEYRKEGLFRGRGEHTSEHCGPSRHSHL